MNQWVCFAIIDLRFAVMWRDVERRIPDDGQGSGEKGLCTLYAVIIAVKNDDDNRCGSDDGSYKS